MPMRFKRAGEKMQVSTISEKDIPFAELTR
jgi:hypothetical protein